MTDSVDRLITLPCTRSLRGPFTAGSALLQVIVPELIVAEPALVRAQATAIHAVAPDLQDLVPPPVGTLTTNAPTGERTRYFSSARPRFLAHGVAQLVNAWANSIGATRATLLFQDLPHADPTDRDLIDVLASRCRSNNLELRTDDGPPNVGETAQAYVDADGVLGEPAAYLSLSAPERARLHSERAQRLVQDKVVGAWLGAIPYHLERGLDPSGSGAEALSQVLEHCFNSGFYDAAVDAARRGLRLVGSETSPDRHSRFTLRLISALSSLGRVAEAMELVHRHRRETISATDQMQCCYSLAMLLTRQPGNAQPLEALAWANTGIALADSFADVGQRAFNGAFMRNARALVELHLGHVGQARDLVEEAIGLTDQHLAAGEHLLHRTVLVHNRARVSLVLGDVASALRDLTLVVDRDPEYEDAFFDRARAHTAAGDVQAAVADYSRAIALRDTFIEAYYNRAVLSLEMDRVDDALSDLTAVLTLDSSHGQALATRAGLYLEVGELDSAHRDVLRGLELQRDSAELLCMLGVLEDERGDTARARASYDRALAADPTFVQAWGNRAVLSFGEGRFEDALDDLNRAISLHSSPELRLNRGIARQSVGDHDGAITDFQVALTEGGDVSELLFRRGLSRLALGDGAAGRADWDAHLASLDGGTSPHADEMSRSLSVA